MPRDYRIKRISAENAALAYPLIRSADPAVSLDAWLEFAGGLNRAGRALAGIIAVESARGYIHGLFSYSVRIALHHKTVLDVENFIALDMGDRAAAIKVLVDAMETLAGELGCSAIHTHIPRDWVTDFSCRTALPRHLCRAGHSFDRVNFCKIIST